MPAFFLALIASVVATLAAREAVRVARLSAAAGGAMPLLAAVWLSSLATSAFAAWLGAELAQVLPAPAKPMLIALSLALAAIEVVVLRPKRAPREATRSFPAVLLVMLASQGTDATRLLIVALAAAQSAPPLSGAGGAVGSGVVLTFAWAMAGRWETRLPLAALRWTIAAVLLFVAIVTGLNARGLLG